MYRKNDVRWLNGASKLFCISCLVLFIYLLFKYAFSVILPFIIAYIVSLAINPLAELISRKTKIPKKLCAGIFVTLAVALLLVVSMLLVKRLFLELREFVAIGEDGSSKLEELYSRVSGIFEAIRGKLSFSKNIGESEWIESLKERVQTFMTNVGERIMVSVSEALPNMVSGVVARAPSIFIGVIVTLMACYYFCIDGKIINEGIKKAIPIGYREKAVSFVGICKTSAKRYFNAYLILMLITFVELLIGLLVLRVKYAFLVALCVSVLDILPVFGAGTVLLPWAAISFFYDDARLAIGLVILYGIIIIIRQIIEPYVVGTSIGVHPAGTLFSMYLGLKLFGFLGMLAGPAVAVVIAEFMKGNRGEGKKRCT